MNNILYALYFNLWLFFGFTYWLKYQDAYTGFGIIGVGVLICYVLDDIFLFFRKKV